MTPTFPAGGGSVGAPPVSVTESDRDLVPCRETPRSLIATQHQPAGLPEIPGSHT